METCREVENRPIGGFLNTQRMLYHLYLEYNMSMNEWPKSPHIETASPSGNFSGLDAVIEKDPMGEADAYMLKFSKETALTSIRIVFNDYSGADLVITNMTTLPFDQVGKGFGSSAIKDLLAWAQSNGMKDIRAVQVQKQSADFWKKNGFVRMVEPNPTNDFVFNEA